MALPALADEGADIVVLRSLVPILRMAELRTRIVPLDRGFRGFRDAVSTLRIGEYGPGILLSAAFSAAFLFRVGGVSHLRGTATDGRSLLLADAVPRHSLGRRHRMLQYRFLMRQPMDRPLEQLRIRPTPGVVDDWRTRLLPEGQPAVGLFPGSNAAARRWETARFVDLARRISTMGAGVVVLGGPAERDLTAEVTAGTPGVLDAGGRTDLEALACVLSLCDLLVTNDTGPMHLAGAVGTPTLTLWGSSDPSEVHPVGSEDVVVREGPLPCMPCKRNTCPRSGRGYVLPEARNECLALITVERVVSEVERLLAVT